MKNQHHTDAKGSLEVICGSMFSGKSEELIRRVKRAELAQKNVRVFKHSLDDRSLIEYVVSHNGGKLKALAVEKSETIGELTGPEVDVIGIDEAQFFTLEILGIVCELVDAGKRVIVAGLDLDFRCEPFGPMPALLAIADHITKLKAVCMLCGKEAHFTQRLVNGRPANYSDPLILIGAQEAYQARCRDCHVIDSLAFRPKNNELHG